MKVGICLFRVADIRGGNTESIYPLAHELEQRGVGIEFLLPKIKEKLPFKARFFDDSSSFNRPYDPRFPLLLAEFVKEVKSFSKDVDIIQIDLPTPAFSVLGDFVKKDINTKVIVNFGSILYPKILMPGKSIGIPLFVKSVINSPPLTKISRYNCDSYVISSEYQKNELEVMGFPKSKISLIPNTFNINKLERWKKDKKKIKKLPAKGPIITYAGHFNWQKGVDLLLRAFPEVLSKKTDASIVLAWSSWGDKKIIERQLNTLNISNNVIVLGRVNLFSLFSSSDVLVLPYKVGFGTQSFPSTILEAFYINTPLVSTDVEPINEIFLSGKTAHIVKPNDPSEIARGILKVLSDKDLVEKMKHHQQRLIKNRFMPGIVANKYIKLYKSLL